MRALRLAAVTLVGVAVLPGPAVSAGDAVSLFARPAEIRSGATTVLTGTLRADSGAAVGGAPLELQADPYPYRRYFDAAHTSTAPDGSFGFGTVRPDRNTRYRVRSAAGFSRPLFVYVDVPATLRSFDHGPGRAMLTMVSRHSAFFHWIGVPTYWYVARRGSRSFHLAAVSRTRELRPGLTYATATVDPPTVHFDFRVCFNPTGEAGAGSPAFHSPCPHRDFLARAASRR
ncbi:MAG: hypothetical protein ACR2KV_09235 [Solirubrobacteraceae bacterium]